MVIYVRKVVDFGIFFIESYLLYQNRNFIQLKPAPTINQLVIFQL
ncbi:MAG: hypothetical protein ACJAZP_004030, partial [Psychromonas sp.]